MSNSAIKPALTSFPESCTILFIWIISPSLAGTDTRASWRKCDWKCALVAFLHAAPPVARSCRVDLIIIQLPGWVWFHRLDPRGAQRVGPPAPLKGATVTEPSVRGSTHYSCLIRPTLWLPEHRPGAPLLTLNHLELQHQQGGGMNLINGGP